jgi:hypothetical protein
MKRRRSSRRGVYRRPGALRQRCGLWHSSPNEREICRRSLWVVTAGVIGAIYPQLYKATGGDCLNEVAQAQIAHFSVDRGHQPPLAQ